MTSRQVAVLPTSRPASSPQRTGEFRCRSQFVALASLHTHRRPWSLIIGIPSCSEPDSIHITTTSLAWGKKWKRKHILNPFLPPFFPQASSTLINPMVFWWLWPPNPTSLIFIAAEFASFTCRIFWEWQAEFCYIVRDFIKNLTATVISLFL
jgi:hypothetical protein